MILSQLMLGWVALAAAQQPAATPIPEGAAPSPGEITKEQASALISTCGKRRFETTAEVPRDGKMRRTRITLCAADSDTNAEWLSKLEKAAAQIEAHPTFPEATKNKLLGDVRAEIERVKSGPVQDTAVAASTGVAVAAPEGSTPAAPLTAAPRVPPRSPLADFSPLPPLPRAAAPAAPAASATATAAAPVRPGPKMSVRCAIAGDDRTQGCGTIASDERLVVRATEPFDGPVSLRFVRNDGTSAEVPFASQRVRAGQTVRFSIPKAICSARIRAKFDIEAISPLINGGRSGERIGSFEARCAA